MDGFLCFRKDRTNANKKRSSGGIIVMYKNHLKDGISFYNSSHDGSIWIKLDKDFFTLQSELYCYA